MGIALHEGHYLAKPSFVAKQHSLAQEEPVDIDTYDGIDPGGALGDPAADGAASAPYLQQPLSWS
jgi:hypothetical protein